MASAFLNQGDSFYPVSYEPKEVAKWLEQLPMANLTRACNQVYSLLLKPPPKAMRLKPYLKSLDLICEVVTELTKTVEENYILDATLSQLKRRHIMKLGRVLNMEMAKAYAASLHLGKHKISRDEARHAISSAMERLNYLLLISFEIYSPPPKNWWRRVFQLYINAERFNLLEEDNDKYSIAKSFKISLLLTSCNPYQLRSKDLRKVFSALHDWADLADLHSPVEASDLFIVKLDTDDAPVYRTFIREENVESHWRGICTERLVSYISSPLGQEGELSDIVIQQLIRQWTALPTRAFKRTQQDGSLNVAIGLAATHFYSNDGQIDMETSSNSIRYLVEGETEVKDNTLEYTLNEATHNHFHRPDLLEQEDKKDNQNDMQSCWEITTPRENIYKKYGWELVNSSDNGYCLCSTSDFPEFIEVGEIVAMQEKNTTGHTYWHIGTIRWLKYTEQDQLELGIQLLSDSAIPIKVRKNTGTMRDYLDALILPPHGDDLGSATLIAPVLPFETQDVVQLANKYIDSDAYLNQCESSNYFYKQFSFVIIEDFAEDSSRWLDNEYIVREAMND